MELNNNYIKESIFLKLLYLLTIVVALFIVTPYMYRNMTRQLYVVIALWVIVAFFVRISTGIKLRYTKLLVLVSIWCLWMVLLRAIGYSQASLGNYFNILMFYFLFYVMATIETYMSDKRKKNLIICISILIVFNLINNIILNIKYEYASTLIFTSNGSMYLQTNIGATNFSAMIFLFCGILMVFFLNKKGIIGKMVCLMLIFSSCYLIFYQHARATATMLTIIMILLLVLERTIKSKSKHTKLMIRVVILILLITILMPVLKVIIELIGNDRLLERFNSILNFINGSESIQITGGDSLATRLYLALTSLKTFISNPINFLIGVGYNLVTASTMYDMLEQTGVGYHAELIDVFGTYGIIGAYFVFSILKEFWKIIDSKLLDERLKSQMKIIYGAFITFSIVNVSFRAEIGIVIIIILPYIPLLIIDKSQKMEL